MRLQVVFSHFSSRLSGWFKTVQVPQLGCWQILRVRNDWKADRIEARAGIWQVAQVDYAVGQLFTGLEDRGYMDESLIVFGDHGEI